MDTTVFMRSIDTRFRAASGLSERRHYSIFYSQVVPSRILVIGFNPGGDPDHWDESLLASHSFYELGEHEYVDCEYRIAVAMRTFLMSTLSLTDVNQIRTIPKTNLVFRRSSNQDTLKISSSRALKEAHPFIEEIITWMVACTREKRLIAREKRQVICPNESCRFMFLQRNLTSGNSRSTVLQESHQ